ncbi:MAG: flagellar assembly protein FliW [Planctomycetia bacterium]|nr:flagellar assembly protein FliW [Planctomycetia bacterium]
MQIRTTRFGTLTVEPEDILTFRTGFVGLEDCRQWILLADASNEALGWLQCTTRSETALAVVSPRRFVPDYRFRTFRSEMASIDLVNMEESQVLVTVSRHDGSLTLNLKAPIVINVRTRHGRQVVANDDHPLQYLLPAAPSLLKKSA